MKKFYTLIIIFVFACTACKNNDTDEHKANLYISVCGVRNPEWLMNEIYKMQSSWSEEYYFIKVCWIEYDEQEYVFIWNMLSSSMCDGMRFYTCSGESVACDSSLYSDLMALYDEGNYVVLWFS